MDDATDTHVAFTIIISIQKIVADADFLGRMNEFDGVGSYFDNHTNESYALATRILAFEKN